MKTFEYRGYDARGAVQRGLVEAIGIKEARERLASDGILAERVSVTGRQIRLSNAERAVIYRELSALLAAGLPLVRALDILIAAPEAKDARLCLAGVRDRVREGMSLADAVSEASRSVTDFESAIIEAAEKSATVEETLERLADFLDEREALRQRVQAALIYPSIVFAAGVCVAILMLGLLIPRTRDLLDAGNAALPALTAFMIGFGRVLTRWGLPVLVLAVVAVLSVRKRIAADPGFRRRCDRLLFRLPVAGKGYTLLVNERFCRTLAVLLRGGVSLIDGVVLAGKATGSAWVGELADTAAESVRHGDKLSDAVQRVPPLAVFLPGWLRIGEAGGDMARLLENAGDRFNARWDRFIKFCLGLLEPVLILAIGGFVLLITLAVLLPVFTLSSGL